MFVKVIPKHGGLSANFLIGLHIDNVVYCEELNEYQANSTEKRLYDFKLDKCFNNLSIPNKPKDITRYYIDIKYPQTVMFTHMLGFIKHHCGMKCFGNYPSSKKPILEFNKKHKVHINPYSEMCNEYFKINTTFDEDTFIKYIRFRAKQIITSPSVAAKLPSNKDIILYYEDIFFHQRTTGTLYEGFENQIKEYHLKNIALIKSYSKLLDIPYESIISLQYV